VGGGGGLARVGGAVSSPGVVAAKDFARATALQAGIVALQAQALALV
jgi:hypothetical protein